MQEQHQQQPSSANTLVCVRLRPPSAKETPVRCIRAHEDAKSVQLTNPGDQSSSLYTYDAVFGEEQGQADVFASCSHIVSCVLSGYNGTIMAYGQTGSGKTHTLIGSLDGEQRGLVPRAVEALGQGIEADSSGAQFEVRLSVVEIYCERIRDLLDPGRDNLQVKKDAAGAIFIEGALEAQVGSEAQLVGIMHQGLAARTVAATCMNAASSRSHCVVTVTVEKACADGSVLVGKLKLVDLAGSERQDKTLAAGQALVEGSQINKSLSTLANVIYALTDSSNAGGGGGGEGGGGKHVPFRDSKLTRVLQDSLGGSSRTMLIICCSPCMENGPETLSSLRFGSRARGLKSKPALNVRLDPQVLRQQLDSARAQVKELQQQLAVERERSAALLQERSTSDSSGNEGLTGSSTAAADGPSSTASCQPSMPTPPDSSTAPDQQGDKAAAAQRGSPPAPPGVAGGRGGMTCSRLLRQNVPWWQHMVAVSVTAVTVAAYARWEHSVYWGVC